MWNTDVERHLLPHVQPKMLLPSVFIPVSPYCEADSVPDYRTVFKPASFSGFFTAARSCNSCLVLMETVLQHAAACINSCIHVGITGHRFPFFAEEHFGAVQHAIGEVMAEIRSQAEMRHADLADILQNKLRSFISSTLFGIAHPIRGSATTTAKH